MQFKLLGATTLPLQTQLQWLWYSEQSNSFVAGDDRAAFLLPLSNPANPSRSQPARIPQHHPCNLPIPNSTLDEFLSEPWHGFRFLKSSEYDNALDQNGNPVGDLLRTLVFGPDYGHYLLHPPSGLILGLRSGSMMLLCRAGEKFEVIDQTKTRGRAALAFAAHPNESLIAYGDNYGTFHAHSFDQNGFGKATKIAGKERKASRIEFDRAGNTLMLGGMGYLVTYSYARGKFTPSHELATAVRDFLWLEDEKLVVINHGLHGVSTYRYDESGFNKLGKLKPDGAVQQIAVTSGARYIAVSHQDRPGVSVYETVQP